MARRRVEDDLADELVVVAGGRRRRAGGGVVPLHLERGRRIPGWVRLRQRRKNCAENCARNCAAAHHRRVGAVERVLEVGRVGRCRPLVGTCAASATVGAVAAYGAAGRRGSWRGARRGGGRRARASAGRRRPPCCRRCTGSSPSPAPSRCRPPRGRRTRRGVEGAANFGQPAGVGATLLRPDASPLAAPLLWGFARAGALPTGRGGRARSSALAAAAAREGDRGRPSSNDDHPCFGDRAATLLQEAGDAAREGESCEGSLFAARSRRRERQRRAAEPSGRRRADGEMRG